MANDERVELARIGYERSVFGGDHSRLDAAARALDEVEADVALARGRLLHARFLEHRERDEARDAEELRLFERAAALYHALGDVRGEAEALFWLGCYQQVVIGDEAAAVPPLQRSRELADDPLTLSYTLRHLGFSAHAAGRPAEARELLEASTRLRREVGFLPGIAANLLALAEVAAEEGQVADARAMLDEATDLATRSEAFAFLRYVQQAREQIG